MNETRQAGLSHAIATLAEHLEHEVTDGSNRRSAFQDIYALRRELTVLEGTLRDLPEDTHGDAC